VFKSHHRKTLNTIVIAASSLAVSWGLGVVPAATASAAAAPTPPFTECPVIGSSPSCEILLVVNPDNSVSVLGDPKVGPFDGNDDTLVGILNDSTTAVRAVTVSGSGSGLSQFDGDGICSGDYGTWAKSSGCPYGPTGYEGPGTSFVTSSSLPDSAEVDFTKGLAPGASAYFSLEGALTSAELTAREGTLTCDFVGGSTNPDYCIPADWNVQTVPDSLVQGMEPLNVIISARSTVPLATILSSLPNWKQVTTGTPDTTPRGCLSEETADVTGGARVGQYQSWRLGGCAGGNALAIIGLENHIRIWSQPLPGSTAGEAWFITASLEHDCVIFTKKPPYAHGWHCIDVNGYNEGASKFVENIMSAAARNGWVVTTRSDSRAQRTDGAGDHSGSGEGLNDVLYNSNVEVVTVTTGPSSPGN
jgi:hypothetical protein